MVLGVGSKPPCTIGGEGSSLPRGTSRVEREIRFVLREFAFADAREQQRVAARVVVDQRAARGILGVTQHLREAGKVG